MANLVLKDIIDDIGRSLALKTTEVQVEEPSLLSSFLPSLSKVIREERKDGLNMTSHIKAAGAGSIISRRFLIEQIYQQLLSTYKGQISTNTIDGILSQYHIDYFTPLYTGTLEELKTILNKEFLIKKTDSLEIKTRKLCTIIYQELYGLSVIDGLEFVDGMNEVAANGSDFVWVQFKGVKVRIPKLRFISEDRFLEVIKKATSYDSKEDLSSVNNEVLCQRFHGARVTTTHPPYSSKPLLNIRTHTDEVTSPEECIEKGLSCREIEDAVNLLQPGRPGIVVLGDQGVGKTFYLTRLISTLDDDIAIGTMETMFELNLSKRFPNKNVDQLQFLKDKDPEHVFETFLRFDRDLIINGEIRSKEEAVVTLKAMSRQGRGSMATFHTTSTLDFMYDYRNLLMQTGLYKNERYAEEDIARAVDILILIKLNRKTGYRYIDEVCEVVHTPESKYRPYDLNTLFKYNRKTKKWDIMHKVSDKMIANMYNFDFTEEMEEKLKKIFKNAPEYTPHNQSVKTPVKNYL